MQAIVFSGIQATGKSTFYRERFFHTHVRINLDMLRTRHREQVLLRACFEALQPFVVDNTNLTRRERAVYIAAARAAGFAVTGYQGAARPRGPLRPPLQRLHGHDRRAVDTPRPPQRLGFLAGEIAVPEDFNRMGKTGIAASFPS